MATSEETKSLKTMDEEVLQKESDGEEDLVDLLNSKLSLNDSISDHNKKFLGNLQCPFSWKLTIYERENHISRIETKLKEMDENDEEKYIWFWKKCVLCSILCYEYADEEMWAEALDFCKQSEECVREAKKMNVSLAKCVMGVGIEHICLASRLFVEVKKDDNFPVEDILKNVLPLQSMDKSNQSSVWAFQAAVYMEYGPDGTKDSLKYIKRALELEPNCGQWHFLYGKTLGRIRRKEDKSKIPDKIELVSLESAVNLTDTASYKIVLAQAYRELSTAVFYGKPSQRNEFKVFCRTLNKDSSELYRNALLSNPNNVSINIRCAMGFMKLPYPYRNMELAEECINKALANGPNNLLAVHTAGTLYYRKKDYSKAKKYFLRAGESGVFGAYMDLLRLKYEENKSFDPIPELERIIPNFQREKHLIICQQGSYMFFVKNNFRKALDYWSKVIEEDVHSRALTKHRSLFCKADSHNIIAIILEELIANNLVKNSNKEKQNSLCDLFHTLVKEYPDIDISKYKRRAQLKELE